MVCLMPSIVAMTAAPVITHSSGYIKTRERALVDLLTPSPFRHVITVTIHSKRPPPSPPLLPPDVTVWGGGSLTLIVERFFNCHTSTLWLLFLILFSLYISVITPSMNFALLIKKAFSALFCPGRLFKLQSMVRRNGQNNPLFSPETLNSCREKSFQGVHPFYDDYVMWLCIRGSVFQFHKIY